MSYTQTNETVFAPRSSSFWQTLQSRFHNWKTRRKVIALADMDDRLLNDIGVTYDDIIWASKLPLNVNAALEMDRVARTRRRKTNQNWYVPTPVR